ncbi:MAG TPA: glycoside hydrolase family 18 protein [Trebonia sp.]|nr:glycoside hydrolase family 18 protein [Trebonia sp.]
MTDAPAPTGAGHGAPKKRLVRRFATRLGAAVLAVIIIACAPFGYLIVIGSGRPSGTIAAAGGDGLWIGHMWVDGREAQANVAQLAATVEADGIRDVFVHDGPLNDDGTLPVKLDPRAAWFVATFHKLAPGIRVQAWLGQEVGTGTGVLDLANKATQARIVASVKYALDVQGFDGVHFDMEPVPSGNWGYVQLLQQVRPVTTQQHKFLSISADQVEPAAGMMAVSDAIAGHPHFWSAGYLHQLAGLVNEVALMDYDTWIPSSPAYAGYTRTETKVALRAMPAGVRLLIGLPAYPPNPPTHDSGETIPAAITGVRLALGSGPPANVGVALYVDFAATPGDWQAYEEDWVKVLHPASSPKALPKMPGY